MTDPSVQLHRRGLTELVREKPELGPVDLVAVTPQRSGGRRDGTPPVTTR